MVIFSRSWRIERWHPWKFWNGHRMDGIGVVVVKDKIQLFPEIEGHTNRPVWSEKMRPVISMSPRNILLVRVLTGSVDNSSTLAAAAAYDFLRFWLNE